MPRDYLVLRVAVPVPLPRWFDYLAPRVCPHPPQPGMRVKVPFGRSEAVGLIMELANQSALGEGRLKHALSLLDEQPLLDESLLGLLRWASAYYHHPIGEVVAAALPGHLRAGRAASLADPGDAQGRAIAKGSAPAKGSASVAGGTTPGMEEVESRREQRSRMPGATALDQGLLAAAPPALNAAQQQAVTEVAEAQGFQVLLLQGVTGSGKTEVYLRLIERVVARGAQVLVLAPEIGLTPQLLARFQQRFAVPIAVLHSALGERERTQNWLAARAGRAPIVLGTRSAVFTPLARPGLIIIDEEHDASFKQQDGFRYHARDVAILRAQRAGIPVLLGSATPAFESLYNVRQGRYRALSLPERAGGAAHPEMRLLDVRHQVLQGGMSAPLLDAVGEHLARGEQVLLFLNRRGFAPLLMCHACGWSAQCERCDARMVLYLDQARALHCQHCGAQRARPEQCAACQSAELRVLGYGTERVEQTLREHFPEAEVLRIDRDSTRRKGALNDLLARAQQGGAQILIGTQMLAKGHHLPNVTLAGILNVDQGLFGADFRAAERMAQLIVQVAGRAGRAHKPGRVLIQTHHPTHPLLTALIRDGYAAFAEVALTERKHAHLPPYSSLALLRAEAVNRAAPLEFLRAAQAAAEPLAGAAIQILGPVSAPMERRAGRYRAQLLVQAARRNELQRLLDAWMPLLETIKTARKVRWSLDVDPVEIL